MYRYVFPTSIIFKGKQHQKAWLTNSDIPSDEVIALSKNGWTNNEIALHWLKDHFEIYTKNASAANIGSLSSMVMIRISPMRPSNSLSRRRSCYSVYRHIQPTCFNHLMLGFLDHLQLGIKESQLTKPFMASVIQWLRSHLSISTFKPVRTHFVQAIHRLLGARLVFFLTNPILFCTVVQY